MDNKAVGYDEQLRHIAYEFDMLEQCAVLLIEHDETARGVLLTNLAIGNFFQNARSLIEFFRADPGSSIISAEEITGTRYPEANTIISDRLYQKLQAQISHLRKDRSEDEKLTSIEVNLIKKAIERAILWFQVNLPTNLHNHWEQRHARTLNFSENYTASATNVIKSSQDYVSGLLQGDKMEVVLPAGMVMLVDGKPQANS